MVRAGNSMNHLRFFLVFLVLLGSYGPSSGQDQQQPAHQSQPQQPQYGVMDQPLAPATTREWTGLVPGYQQPAGVEAQYGVMSEVRASRNLRPSDAQLMMRAPALGPDGKPLPGRSIVTRSTPPSSGNAYRSPVTSSGAIRAHQRNPSKQVVRTIPGSGQNGVKPMAGEKLVSRDAPGSFNEYRAQLLNTLLPKPEPHELIMRCGVQGRSADVVTGRCM